MSYLLISLFLFTGASIQTLLTPFALFGSLDWPILTGLLIFIVLHSNRGRGIYASVLAGILYDSFSLAPLGTSLPFFGIVGAGVFALREVVVTKQVVTYIILGVLAVALKLIYFTLVLSGCGMRPMNLSLFPVRLLGSIALGFVVVPLVYFSLRYFQRMIPQFGRWD